MEINDYERVSSIIDECSRPQRVRSCYLTQKLNTVMHQEMCFLYNHFPFLLTQSADFQSTY